jgi:hypothetical protein
VFAAFEALGGTAANFSDTAYESKADMSNTGQLFIDAPSGSFTTLSGHDYSTDAGVSSAPEPSTWAMLLIDSQAWASPRAIGWPAHRRRPESGNTAAGGSPSWVFAHASTISRSVASQLLWSIIRCRGIVIARSKATKQSRGRREFFDPWIASLRSQ